MKCEEKGEAAESRNDCGNGTLDIDTVVSTDLISTVKPLQRQPSLPALK